MTKKEKIEKIIEEVKDYDLDTLIAMATESERRYWEAQTPAEVSRVYAERVDLETKATDQGKEFTNRGAYLDDNGGMVYIINRNGCYTAETWHGELIAANVNVVSEWEQYTPNGGKSRMRQVRFSVTNKVYTGRYGYDWSQLCKVKRVKS